MTITVPQIARVLAYVVETIANQKLPHGLNQLGQTLQSLAGTPTWNDNQRKDVQRQRTALREALTSSAPPVGWSSEEYEFFKQMGAEALLGAAGLKRFDDAFATTIGNYHHTAEALHSLSTEVTILDQRARWMLESLAPFAAAVIPSDGRVPVIASVPDNISLAQLSRLSADWSFIAKAMARFAGESPLSPEVFEVRRGTVFVEFWSAGMATVLFIVRIYEFVQAQRDKRRKKEAEADAFGNPQLRVMIMEAVEAEMTIQRDAFIKELVDSARSSENAGELTSLLDKALTRTNRFADGGGHVSLPALGVPADAAPARLQLEQINRTAPPPALPPGDAPPAQITAGTPTGDPDVHAEDPEPEEDA